METLDARFTKAIATMDEANDAQAKIIEKVLNEAFDHIDVLADEHTKARKRLAEKEKMDKINREADEAGKKKADELANDLAKKK